MDQHSRLIDLRADFLATSSRSMPIAGMIFWTVIAVAALYVSPSLLSAMVLYSSGMIFPLGLLIDRFTGRKITTASNGNPVVQLFLQCLGLVVLMWPLVLIAAYRARNADLIVLGGAILMGVIWIPFGWAADDSVGLQHAIGRSILCYAAYLFMPHPYKATAVGTAVVLSYCYSLVRMRRPIAPAAVVHDKPHEALQPAEPRSIAGHPVPRDRRHWAWIWIAYTGFLFIQPMFDPSWRLWLATLASFAIFLGIFATYVRATDARKPVRFYLIAATFLLGLLCFPWNQGASTFFVYASSFLPFSIRSVRRVLLLFLAECLFILAEGMLVDARFPRHSFFHIGWPNTIVAIFLVLIIGGGNILFAEQRRTDSKLRMANEEIEQLAALAERERIARDLHDVLGHTLSVIVLKAELAGRLLERDPERAAREIGDVERTARTALTEVREAIGGYRARGLVAEFELARQTLAAAGVALSCESPIPRLAPTEETVLALAIREAMTNIIRHARATHCRMTFEITGEGFHRLTVVDDGSGLLSSARPNEGNGLRGMNERVKALGGRLSIISGLNLPSPGTTLTIEIPVAGPTLELNTQPAVHSFTNA